VHITSLQFINLILNILVSLGLISWEIHFIGIYKFLVLPFGLSSAFSVFTKVTRPLIAKWRGDGKFVIMFLDDGFGCAYNVSECEQKATQVKSDLLMSGFSIKLRLLFSHSCIVS